MANLLYHHLYSPSSSRFSTRFKRRNHCLNCEIDLRRSIVRRDSFVCGASRGGRFKFRSEEELFRDGGFNGFGFGFGFSKKKKKRPWWLDDDDDDDDDYNDLMNDEDDWSMVFEVFRTLSWMLAPIGISLLLGTDSNAGLMALAVPLVQTLLSFVVDKVLSRPSISRPMKRSRRGSFSRSTSVSSARKGREEENMGGVVGKEGGYKSWMVGDVEINSMSSRYGGWDDLVTQREIRNDENVRSKQQFKRKASRPWRVKEKPLFLRMLIASFPFLGSWTKLFF
ncbi:hypothetical protein AALP_AA3G038000 [Arabis alpina]|uniref:Uncharacterized protein n=1 Tax=Arabis alpina TaxID=50452 RepID=A0A087H6V3_ARAAL|nr:hypothetical protein AALP_AA3G038000 [Arabis alpina]